MFWWREPITTLYRGILGGVGVSCPQKKFIDDCDTWILQAGKYVSTGKLRHQN